MSKSKKKTERIPLPTNKGYTLSIDPTLMGRVRRGAKSPLDEALESEDVMMARDFKTMRIEEANMKRKVKMAKLQKEIDKLEKDTAKNEKDESAMSGMNLSMARQISMLPPEDQEKIMQTYAAFRSIDQSKGSGNSFLPYLIGFSKNNPGSSQSDMVTYAKAMSDQFKTGIEAMKAVMPKEKASSSTEALKLMKDLIIEGVRNPVLTAIEKSQPQPSAFEQILMNPEMFSRAKEIGMFGSRETKGGSTEMDLKIEQLRGERELSTKRMDLEWRRDMLKRESEDRRTDAILTALAPLTALAAGPINQRMRMFGQQQAVAHNPTSLTQPSEMNPTSPPSSPENTVFIKCSCGYQGLETFQETAPDKINCPNCGLKLNVGGVQGARKPEETDTGTRV